MTEPDLDHCLMEILAYIHIRWNFNALHLPYHSGSQDLIFTSNIHIAWEPLRNANPQAPPPDPPSKELWGGAQQSGFNKALEVPVRAQV